MRRTEGLIPGIDLKQSCQSGLVPARLIFQISPWSKPSAWYDLIVIFYNDQLETSDGAGM